LNISLAAATLYFLPFPETLEIASAAGFSSIELDLYWRGSEWVMAQHLQDISPKQAVGWIHQSGLKVASIHDGGGLLQKPGSTKGYINPSLLRFLDELGYDPELIAFHTPHIAAPQSSGWWDKIRPAILQELEPYRGRAGYLTIENMPPIEGYSIPLLQPQALHEFATQHGLGVTLDTTHYAQMGQDIVEAAQILRTSVRSIHLSDYGSGSPHIFIGDGDLDFLRFFQVLGTSQLASIVVECKLSTALKSDQEMSKPELVERLRLALERLARLV
jgi:sugar phosphate isomerase/epimerase